MFIDAIPQQGGLISSAGGVLPDNVLVTVAVRVPVDLCGQAGDVHWRGARAGQW